MKEQYIEWNKWGLTESIRNMTGSEAAKIIRFEELRDETKAIEMK